MDQLYYGDNLDVLRSHIASESVDLIYLDPPFNSNASYNILFRSPAGSGADASIEAFDDTWSWGPAAEEALLDITRSGNHALHTLMQAMKASIGTNAMMAYLAMMVVRLVELHRVLKDTGSLYLRCNSTASHYLKLVPRSRRAAWRRRPPRTGWSRPSSDAFRRCRSSRSPNCSRTGGLAPPLVSPTRKAPRVETRASHRPGAQASFL